MFTALSSHRWWQPSVLQEQVPFTLARAAEETPSAAARASKKTRTKPPLEAMFQSLLNLETTRLLPALPARYKNGLGRCP
jgi:hypothetical protein